MFRVVPWLMQGARVFCAITDVVRNGDYQVQVSFHRLRVHVYSIYLRKYWQDIILDMAC